MDPHEGQGTSHEPTPTIWPVGFAVGIACIFVGLIISKIVLVVGVVVAAIFGFLWIRDATKPFRHEEAPADVEPPPAPRQPPGARAAVPTPVRARLSATRARSSSRRRRSAWAL